MRQRTLRGKRRSFQNESEDSLVVSEEASSGSGGSASTSLEVNSEDVAIDDQISGAPSSFSSDLHSHVRLAACWRASV